MFNVEDYLEFTRNATIPDSYVIENAADYVPELEGFYVCLTKDHIPAIKDFISGEKNATFILKTFELDPTNGLSVLRVHKKINSYTELFVKYYGGVSAILENPMFTSSSPVELQTQESEDVQETLPEITEEIIQTKDVAQSEEASVIDASIFDDAFSSGIKDNADQIEEVSEEPVVLSKMAQDEEVMLLLRAIASKLGIMEYDDSSILSKAEMKKAQKAVKVLSPITVQEAFIGALSLAERKEDLSAVTRFLELFYTYINNKGLIR
jgi:hypothetical protein